MKSLFKLVIPAVLFFLIPVNFSLAAAGESSPAQKIFKQYKINLEDLSLEIRKDDKIIDEINANVVKNPASVSKLMTTFGVLQRLPLGFRYKTQLFFENGIVYLKGAGDPSFVSEKMWFLVNEFIRTQTTTVKEIVVDESLFDPVRFDESRENARVDRAYDAPVGAMSFNWNSVNVFVRPGLINGKAVVHVDPASDYYQVSNLTTTVGGKPKKELAVSISSSSKTVTVSGEISKDSLEKVVYKSIDDPALWSGQQLKSFLKQRGVTVAGKVYAGITPDTADLVASSESKSLAEILADMNKFSNNFVAEMLTKTLAAQDSKKAASLKKGVEIIRDELKNAGLSTKDFIFVNPSGLTPDNRLSAHGVNQILMAMKKDFRTYSLVLESLPVAGLDGTLKKRMKNTVAEGWVRGKTGYLNTVAALSGYAGRKNGDVYTYTFLYNGPRDEAIVREAFDQVLINLLK